MWLCVVVDLSCAFLLCVFACGRSVLCILGRFLIAVDVSCASWCAFFVSGRSLRCLVLCRKSPMILFASFLFVVLCCGRSLLCFLVRRFSGYPARGPKKRPLKKNRKTEAGKWATGLPTLWLTKTRFWHRFGRVLGWI